jgi:hypothetical protein
MYSGPSRGKEERGKKEAKEGERSVSGGCISISKSVFRKIPGESERGKKKAENFRKNGNSNCRPCGISIYRDHGISVYHCPRIQLTISKRLEAHGGRSALASE